MSVNGQNDIENRMGFNKKKIVCSVLMFFVFSHKGIVLYNVDSPVCANFLNRRKYFDLKSTKSGSVKPFERFVWCMIFVKILALVF